MFSSVESPENESKGEMCELSMDRFISWLKENLYRRSHC